MIEFRYQLDWSARSRKTTEKEIGVLEFVSWKYIEKGLRVCAAIMDVD